MNINEIRLDCLRLAMTKEPDVEKALEIARKLSDYALGTEDGARLPPRTAPRYD